MLARLTVTDMAVVGEAVLEFGTGLNIVSGETGVGKSLLLNAVGLVAGERGSGALVRPGAKAARVEAVFHPDDPKRLGAQLRALGLRELDEEWLIIRREIAPDGRSRAFVGGEQVLISTLQTLGERLVDLHGQGEGQLLLRPSRQREHLDELAKTTRRRSRLAELIGRERELTERLGALRRHREEVARQREFFQHQLREILDARLAEDEEDQLRRERQLILRSEQVSTSVSGLLDSLQEADGSAAERVARATDHLATLVAFDPDLRPLQELLEQARIEIEEVARTVAGRFREIDFRPERRDEIEARLDLIARLKRKYGGDVPHLLRHAAMLERQLQADEAGDAEERALAGEREALRGEAAEIADALGAARKRAAATLSRSVEKILPALGMKDARFEVRLETIDDPEAWYERNGRPVRLGPEGAEQVEFRLSANPGQPPGPLARIASGGELSRVMLAIKVNLAEATPAEVMVFDEVDAGVGGRTARAVGVRIREIAADRQVIAVTHLAAVACQGERHYLVDKVTRKGTAHVEVRVLDGEARVGEIARMLSGSEGEKTAHAHARELLAARRGA